MRRSLPGLLTLILILLPSLATCQVEGSSNVYVFILDTSGSMVGKPAGSGNVVIFPEVKRVIKNYIDEIDVGSTVFVFPFDEGIHDHAQFTIGSRRDLDDVKSYVNDLGAEGKNTWIYRSLRDVIDRVQHFKKLRGGDHTVVMYLYTDGLDNDRAYTGTMRDIVDYFDLNCGPRDWLFYCTLGVELPPDDAKVIGDSPRAAHIKQPAGVVHPILTLIAKTPVLNYGNLWGHETGKRTALFGLPPQQHMPPDLAITAELIPQEDLIRRGLGVEIVSSLEFEPARRTEFEFEIVNFFQDAKECYGSYEARLVLATNDPLVFVVPNEILVRFKYEPPMTASLRPCDGDSFPLDLGEIIPHGAASGRDSVSRRIQIDYISSSPEQTGALSISWLPEANNPSALVAGKNLRINGLSEEHVSLAPPQDEIVIEVVGTGELNPGKYRGIVSLRSDEYAIVGEGVVQDESNASAVGLPWTFAIPRPPTPLWQKILLILGILAAIALVVDIIYYLRNGEHIRVVPQGPPLIPDGTKIEIRDPKERRGEEVDISGLSEVVYGESGTDFQDAAQISLTLRPVRVERRVLLNLVVECGEVYLKRMGESAAKRVLKERVFDGDTIAFERYTLRISSFSLTE